MKLPLLTFIYNEIIWHYFQIHGPFEIVLANKYNSGKESIVIFSYNFPEVGDPNFKPSAKTVLFTDRQRKLDRDETRKPAIPIEQLEKKYLSRNKSLQNEENPSTSQSSKPDISLDLFISSISNHLAAYVCRMDQVQELIPKDDSRNEFSEVYDVKFSRDLRLVTFTLKIVDGDATNGKFNQVYEEFVLVDFIRPDLSVYNLYQ